MMRVHLVLLALIMLGVLGGGISKIWKKQQKRKDFAEWKPKQYHSEIDDIKTAFNGKFIAELPGKAALFRISNKSAENAEFFDSTTEGGVLILHVYKNAGNTLLYLKKLFLKRDFAEIINYMAMVHTFREFKLRAMSDHALFFNKENRKFFATMFVEMLKTNADLVDKKELIDLATIYDMMQVCDFPANPSKLFFEQAVRNNAKECVKVIMKKMKTFDEKIFWTTMTPTTSNMFNALEYVATRNWLDRMLHGDWGEMCDILLQNGMEDMINKVNEETKKTPLLLAVFEPFYRYRKIEHPNPKVVECLARYGTNSLDFPDERGVTALRHAVFNGRDEICNILLKNGADANETLDGQTLIGDAITTLVQHGRTGCLRLLVKYGDVNAVYGTGFGETTHLNMAILYHHGELGGEICKLLLRNGADPNHLGNSWSPYNSLRMTPLMLAVTNDWKENMECIKAILGANPNLRTESKAPWPNWTDVFYSNSAENKPVEYFAENNPIGSQIWKELVNEYAKKRHRKFMKIIRYGRGIPAEYSEAGNARKLPLVLENIQI